MKDDKRQYDWYYMPDYWVQGGTKAKSAVGGGTRVKSLFLTLVPFIVHRFLR